MNRLAARLAPKRLPLTSSSLCTARDALGFGWLGFLPVSRGAGEDEGSILVLLLECSLCSLLLKSSEKQETSEESTLPLLLLALRHGTVKAHSPKECNEQWHAR